jgi:hypothetical protein
MLLVLSSWQSQIKRELGWSPMLPRPVPLEAEDAKTEEVEASGESRFCGIISFRSFLDGKSWADMSTPEKGIFGSSMKPANDLSLRQNQSATKYPSEDECYIRRFGSALLLHWSELSEDLRNKILADAACAWDREMDIPHIARKLDIFIRRYLTRISTKSSD